MASAPRTFFNCKIMMIKNFDQLATNSLRKQALLIVEAGLEAIRTEHAVKAEMRYDARKGILSVADTTYALATVKRVVVVGFGKAAYDAVTTIYELLGARIACGFVLDLKGGSQGSLTCTIGSHPYPTLVNVAATKQIVEVVTGLTEEDLLLCVVSGGGSSLLCYPYELTCETETQIVQVLMRAGADIHELNTVRKHISMVKGGQLAQAAYPAQVVNLVFSDVPGDDLGMVASGPTMLDSTTAHDAAAVLEKYNVLALCNMASCNLRETPKEQKYFERVSSHMIVSASKALHAMKVKANDLGFAVRIYKEGYAGRAQDLAKEFVHEATKGQCLLASGESTVQMNSASGKGGRNLEMALAALPLIGEKQLFLALDSDGYDNTSFAGALVDTHTLTKARQLSLDVRAELNSHNSYVFFETVGDYVETGLTGANVADLVLVLTEV